MNCGPDRLRHRRRLLLCEELNVWLRVDEGMDVFELHGVGSIVRCFMTGIFAQEWVSSLDGATFAPGGLDGNGVQIGKQLADICAIASYSFTVSCILLLILKYIPRIGLRVSDETEMIGLDVDQFFDEQIGDWSMFEQNKPVTIGGLSQPVSSSASVTEGVKTA